MSDETSRRILGTLDTSSIPKALREDSVLNRLGLHSSCTAIFDNSSNRHTFRNACGPGQATNRVGGIQNNELPLEPRSRS